MHDAAGAGAAGRLRLRRHFVSRNGFSLLGQSQLTPSRLYTIELTSPMTNHGKTSRQLGYQGLTHLLRQARPQQGVASGCKSFGSVWRCWKGERLAREDTFCHDSITQAARAWLQEHRSTVAAHWNLLTDMKWQDLPYASQWW